MNEVARLLDMAPIRVYEIATFYTMFQLHRREDHVGDDIERDPPVRAGTRDQNTVTSCRSRRSRRRRGSRSPC